MTPKKFGAHLDLMRKMGFETISLTRLHDVITGKARLTAPAIVITFDDCTLDNWIHAVPELLRRDMCGVFFAITDFVLPGRLRPRADQTSLPQPVSDFSEIMRRALTGDCAGFMNQTEIRVLTHDLGMEVYPHSAAHQACFTTTIRSGVLADNTHWSHRALLDPNAPAHTPVHPVGSAYAHAGFGLDWRGQPLELSPAEQRAAFCLDDFATARTCLEGIIGQACPFLCLPWGQYDDVTLDAAKLAGYSSVLTLDRTPAGPGTDPRRIGRLAVKDGKSLAWLALKTLCLALPPLASCAGATKHP